MVTLISTVLNEAESIRPFLESLRGQTRPPDQVVIVDAGSTDGTAEATREFDGVEVLIEPGCSRSRGRNLAIAHARGEIIAVSDAGCRLNPDWLEKLLAPLEQGAAEVASGYYRPDPRTLLEQAVGAATVPAPQEVNPETFLPSSRSVAFRREWWEKVGGYPEQAELSEDTLFDLDLRKAGARFAFVPEAVAWWRPQGSLGQVFRQFYHYAVSDGRARLFFGHYRKAYLLAVAVVGLAALSGWFASARWALAALILLYALRYTLRARRRGASWPAALLSVAVTVTVDLAHAVGYAMGSRYRQSEEIGDCP